MNKIVSHLKNDEIIKETPRNIQRIRKRERRVQIVKHNSRFLGMKGRILFFLPVARRRNFCPFRGICVEGQVQQDRESGNFRSTRCDSEKCFFIQFGKYTFTNLLLVQQVFGINTEIFPAALIHSHGMKKKRT